MYNNPGAAAGGLGSGLALTGMTGNIIWMFLSAFALLALGMAVLRTVPRHEE